jgi:hypothetical protein
LQNFFDFSIGFAIVLATMGAITVGLFIFFKKKQWILTGSDPLDSGVNSGSKAGTSSDRERFNDLTSKKEQQESHFSTDHTNPRNKVAETSADKVRGSET